MSNPPPQAYTRETLAEAYAWFNNQPDGAVIRATSADQLVSLYLRSKRAPTNGHKVVNTTETHPISSQSFKSELKELAEGIRQFETTEPVPAPQVAFNPAPIGMAMPEVEIETMRNPTSPSTVTFTQKSVEVSAQDQLDDKSLEMLKSVRNRFNLSSNDEALRMLLVLGYESLNKIFK